MRAPDPTPRPSRRPGHRRTRPGSWQARCRALGLALPLLLSGPVSLSARLVLSAALLASAGCGPLLFLPSAFTPQKVELVYSVQEDITLVRWRISSSDPSDPDLRFEMVRDSGDYDPIDFSQSAYAGGAAPCADGVGSCFQYVVRGAYTPPDKLPPVRAVHAREGVLPGGFATASKLPTTLGLVSFFHTGNDVVYVNVTDKVAQDGVYVFPRAYQRAIWPTKGLCVSGSPPDGVGFSPLGKSGGFPPPAPLTDDGIYCVGLQPVAADVGPTALAQARVATLPEVTSVQLAFTPPIEKSPIIYQIILDLEIPVADRCASSIRTIEALVDATMNSVGVPVSKMPTVNLAVDPDASGGPSACAQPQLRAVDADAMAQAIKQTASTYPQINQQVHLLYFNNLNGPLPPTLTNSLQTLFDDLSIPPPGIQQFTTISWLFNPGLAMATGPNWSMFQPWQAADDPTLTPALVTYAQQNLPYISQMQDPTVPVPVFTPDQVAAYAGGLFKVCNTNVVFQVVDSHAGVIQGSGPTWSIPGDDPPAVAVYLPPRIAVPSTSFTPAGLRADLQVCTRYCTNHPFISSSGAGQTSWSASDRCAELE